MKRPHKNALEWSVFVVSAALLVAVLGYLASRAMRGAASPPDLRIVTGAPRAAAGAHRVPVTVRNAGDSTAESVRIEVLLLRGSEEVERGEIDFLYVPHQSERHGWVTFRRDPHCCTIVARAVGYGTP